MVNEFISIDLWKMLAVWCNLMVLVFLMKKFLFKPVQEILAKRQAEIDNSYEEAQKAETQAIAMREEYEENLNNAKEEATQIVKNATQSAQMRGEEVINQAKQEAQAIKEKASKDIENERKNAAKSLKNDISAIAISLAGKVVEKEVDAKQHQDLIESFIDGVGDAS